MAHDPHESLPGYSPAQLLHDGCDECEMRAASPAMVISHLDGTRFADAWLRAIEVHTDRASDVSRAERPALDALWEVAVQLEARGLRLGEIPGVLLQGRG